MRVSSSTTTASMVLKTLWTVFWPLFREEKGINGLIAVVFLWTGHIWRLRRPLRLRPQPGTAAISVARGPAAWGKQPVAFSRRVV